MNPRDASAPPWEPPIPLTAGSEVPVFPTEHLPLWVADMVDACAIATQTPTALPGLAALSALALAVAGKVEVEVRTGYRETLALYSLISLPPANRKSAVFEAITAPLREWEKECAEAARPENETLRQRRKVGEQTLEARRRDAASATGGDRMAALAEVDDLAREFAEMKDPSDPRLIVSDATPERIAALLAENGGRLGVFCPEGSALLRILGGAYSRDGSSNLSVILNGHSGDMLRVDRQSRPPVHVDRPVLVLLVVVQEAVLEDLRQHRDFHGQGLLGRIVYARPESLIGSRRAESPPIPATIAARYRDGLRRLLNAGPDRDGDGRTVPHVLHVSEAARRLLYSFHDRLEPRLGPGGDLAHRTDWAGKAVGLCARIGALFHLGDRIEESQPWAVPITEDAMRRAIHYVEDVLLPHAEAALDLIDQPPESRLAEAILDWIRRESRRDFSRADLYRSMRNRRDVKRSEDLSPALSLLTDLHYLRRTDDDGPRKAGRPRSPRFAVNPTLDREVRP